MLCGCVQPLGHGTEGVSTPFNVQTHAPAHIHTHTHTHVPISAGCSTGNAYPPAPWVSVRPGLQQTGTINVGFHVFHVLLCCLSACVRPGARVCVRRVRCLIRGKILCYFQMALFKRLLWCTKSDLKCACSLPLIFSKKPGGEACPLGCCHFTFSTAELFKDSNGPDNTK